MKMKNSKVKSPFDVAKWNNYLKARLEQEQDELRKAVTSEEPERVARECKLLSDFALMVANNMTKIATENKQEKLISKK